MFKSNHKKLKDHEVIETDKNGLIPWHKRKHMLENEYTLDEIGVPKFDDCCKDIQPCHQEIARISTMIDDLYKTQPAQYVPMIKHMEQSIEKKCKEIKKQK